jgi:hypothetical protein
MILFSYDINENYNTEIAQRLIDATHQDCVVEPFCPTNENVPFANHRSFASFTRCAAARFVNSNPCTGVTMRDDAVPDVCAEFAARASAAVRSRFDFDILAARRQHKSNK